MARIVLISDDPERSERWTPLLERRGHEVAVSRCRENELAAALELKPDMLIVDMTRLPAAAFRACQRLLAREDVHCAVLVIAPRADTQAHLDSLVETADTLAKKQTTPRVTSTRSEHDFMTVDTHRREAIIRGDAIPLTPTETSVLAILADNVGRHITAQELVSRIQGYEVSAREAGEIIRVHIHNLRRKFEHAGIGPPYILSARGKGYMLERRAPRPEETSTVSEDED